MDDTELARLRAEIDGIDRDMQALLQRRAEIVTAVGAAKAGGPIYRPGREARVMRALLERHAGPFPRAALVAIWRQIIGASIAMQAPLVLAVPGGEHGPAGAMARTQFGAAATLVDAADADAALAALAAGDATLALLPFADGDRPWWRAYLEPTPPPPILAHLPAVQETPVPLAAAFAVVGPAAEPLEEAETGFLVAERAGGPRALGSASEGGAPELLDRLDAAQLTLLRFGAFVPATGMSARRLTEGPNPAARRVAVAGGAPAPVGPAAAPSQ